MATEMEDIKNGQREILEMRKRCGVALWWSQNLGSENGKISSNHPELHSKFKANLGYINPYVNVYKV